jgi:hypothetical protein
VLLLAPTFSLLWLMEQFDLPEAEVEVLHPDLEKLQEADYLNDK